MVIHVLIAINYIYIYVTTQLVIDYVTHLVVKLLSVTNICGLCSKKQRPAD